MCSLRRLLPLCSRLATWILARGLYNSLMLIDQAIIEGRLLKRYKRFLADIELQGGEIITAHCPNTGSLTGCVEPGSRVILRDSDNPKRKYRWTFQSVEVDGSWVNVDTGLPNALVAEAIADSKVPELIGYPDLRREVKYGESSRIDILLERGDERCYVEVKSTTLAADGCARFPDAVTERGRKHLEELARMVLDGHRAVIFFCVSRSDVDRFEPADDIDPRYGEVLRRVLESGVEALAYRTLVEPASFRIGERLPINL
ncbi:MAG: sugar fermentation stimulation protein A [Planctomycetota bacterium]|jgi:sugar fermentation stimulation protein A